MKNKKIIAWATAAMSVGTVVPAFADTPGVNFENMFSVFQALSFSIADYLFLSFAFSWRKTIYTSTLWPD